jgi:hypothetical protein
MTVDSSSQHLQEGGVRPESPFGEVRRVAAEDLVPGLQTKSIGPIVRVVEVRRRHLVSDPSQGLAELSGEDLSSATKRLLHELKNTHVPHAGERASTRQPFRCA